MLSTLAPHLEFINTDIETYLQANVKRFRGRINVEQLKVFRPPACTKLRAYSHHVHHRLFWFVNVVCLVTHGAGYLVVHLR